MKSVLSLTLSRVAFLGAFMGCGCSSDDPPNPSADAATDSAKDAGPSIQQGTRIRIDTGEIEGEVDGATRRFLGVPFAAPPIGDLRWKPPAPVQPWEGVRATTQFSGKCAQNGGLLGSASDNEDCLYLNVWSPEPAPDKPLPVMLWFHGGGNTTGSASDDVPLGVGGKIFDGRYIAENQHVVVVTTNYRLGALGFFAHPALADEDPRKVSGNQGLLDQRAALAWIRRNIVGLGGDPGNVTIFGESAGSADVCLHMMSPGSRGLFHRGISQSGGCTTFARTRAVAEVDGQAYTAALGCTDPASVLSCLRSQPVSSLLIPAPVDGGEPKAPGGSPYQGGKPRWAFGVSVDGDMLKEQPRALVDRGDFAKVPYIIGSNTDEGTIFHIGEPSVTTEAEYAAALERRFGKDVTPGILARYPVSDFPNPQEALMRVTGDSSLVCGTYDTARRVADAGVPVFLYNFDRPIPIAALAGFNLRATHGAEIAYIFGTAPPADFPAEDAALGLLLQGYWARLARTGDPNGDAAPAWPAFRRDADVRLNFNLQPSPITDFRRSLCDFWATYYERSFN